MEGKSVTTSEGGRVLYIAIGILVGVLVLIIAAFFCNSNRTGKRPENDLMMEEYLRKLKKEKRKGKDKGKKEHDRDHEHEHQHYHKHHRSGSAHLAPAEKPLADNKEAEESAATSEREPGEDPKEEKYVTVRQSGRKESGKKQTFSFLDRQEKRKHPIVRICFTGGPCAGKTTALAHCAQQLNQIGIKTFIVPEARTVLNRGGFLMNDSGMSASRLVKLHINLMRTQMALEDILTDIAGDFYPDDRVAILCDRGVMDSAAYMPKTSWQALIDETGWTNTQLRDKRYELVLNLVTAADGAEEFYEYNDKEFGAEDLDDAFKIDHKTRLVWIGHPSYSIIDNSRPGFNNKIQRCLEVIYMFLGLPAATTFYKKFLVLNKNLGDGAFNIKNLETFDVAETYLASKGAEEKVSIRGQTDSCMYTHSKITKEKSEIIERKWQISAREYMKLLEEADKSMKVLNKKRMCFLYNKSYMVLDTYTDVDGTPSVLRVLHEKDAKDPTLPLHLAIVREISDEKEYSNYLMAKNDWTMPEKDKELIKKLEQEAKELKVVKDAKKDQGITPTLN